MKNLILLWLISVILPFAHSSCYNCANNCTNGRCSSCDNPILHRVDNLDRCDLYTPIQSCSVYDIRYDDVCLQCDSRSVLENDRCVPITANCIRADITQDNECTRCEPNYELFKGKCYTEDIRNCPPGSLPNPRGNFCLPFGAKNCITSNNGICTSCEPGYLEVNGRCVNVTSSQPCSEGSEVQCCRRGIIWKGTCYEIAVSNCNILSENISPIYCSAC